MSAAATAAGYLYASGRLRGRAQRDQEEHDEQPSEKRAHAPTQRPRIERPRQEGRGAARPSERRAPAPTQRPRIERPRQEVRVAALPEEIRAPGDKPRRTPTIQYR